MSSRSVTAVNLDVRNMVEERTKIRQAFNARGESFVSWSVERGFNPQMVHAVLHGRMRCARGQAHEIAVALGLKSDVKAAA